VQVGSLLPRLGALEVVGKPENIGVFAWFGLQGGLSQWGPHLLYPGHGHPYGTDLIGHHAKHFGAEVVITLIDVWTQEGVAGKVAPAQWLPWFPIDTQPVSPKVLEALAGAALPIVYSRFGERMLREAGVASAYVPHGIEPAIFQVLDEKVTAQFRAQVLRDAPHVTAMVAANKGFDRKAFQINLRAWAAFAHEEPGAVLYLHTDPTNEAAGVELEALVEALGIGERVIFPDRYSYYLGYPPEYLALVYNAADVLLASSMTEGFGIPIVEAQACGTPVICTDFASMPELLRWGTAVDAADIFWMGLRSWWAWPDWRQIRDALGNVGRMKREVGLAKRKAVSQAIRREFDWDVVVGEHWRPVLEEVSRVVGEGRDHAGAPGAERGGVG
jgi:glycosyltransferase involved in cell wall biosynthesis